MQILICPDKFKGSLSAAKVGAALREGLLSQSQHLNISIHPMADGGDGSLEILKEHHRLAAINIQTVDPLNRKIDTVYYGIKEKAFIELASASGLTLLEEENRNPLHTSTFGTGLMIKDALEKGFKKIYVFIGGSATNDGGIGIAQALGFRFLDKDQNPLDPIGKSLVNIKHVLNQFSIDFQEQEIIVLCDVNNTMHGVNGASYTYAAQKGADQSDILLLDRGLKNFDKILQIQFQKDLSTIQGMGAAGAVGASLVGLLKAKLQNGFQMMADLTQLETAIKKADFVITGEGKVDSTSFQGKVVGNVLSLCQKHRTPCGIVAGRLDNHKIREKAKFRFYKSVMDLTENEKEAMESAEKYLVEIGSEIAKELDQSS